MLTGLMKKYTLYECFVHLRGGPGVFLTSLKTRRTGSPSIAWQMGTKPSMHTLRNGVLPLPHLHASQAPPPRKTSPQDYCLPFIRGQRNGGPQLGVAPQHRRACPLWGADSTAVAATSIPHPGTSWC